MKKYVPRIYIKNHLNAHQIYCLPIDQIHHVKNVLRAKTQDQLEIFNNTNYIFLAKIIEIKKKRVLIEITEKTYKNFESPVHIHLGQIISNKKNMDLTIQKSTELGVKTITPLFFESCLKNKKTHFLKKIQHWQNIIISSCKQCKRNVLPKIYPPEQILLWCKKNNKNNINIIFHPNSQLTLKDLPKTTKHTQHKIGRAHV